MKQNGDKPVVESFNRVVVEFVVAKDGKLVSVKVINTSGDPGVDDSALNAIKLASPFKPLPAGFVGEYCKFQFSFDQNFLGVTVIN